MYRPVNAAIIPGVPILSVGAAPLCQGRIVYSLFGGIIYSSLG